MVESLSQIDGAYRGQIASALTVEEAQSVQAEALKELSRKTNQINFAAEIQKLMSDNEDIFGTEILDSGPGTLQKVTQGLVKSIGRDALLKKENIDSILTGSQEEIINKIRGAFNIDPRLGETLEDFKGTEFAEVIAELRSEVRSLKRTKDLMEKITKEREKEEKN